MRRKRPLFKRDAKFFRGLVDIGRQSFRVRGSLDSSPKNARVFFVGEKTKSAKIERNALIGARTGKRTSNAGEVCFRHFSDEFERPVKILRAPPATCQQHSSDGM